MRTYGVLLITPEGCEGTGDGISLRTTDALRAHSMLGALGWGFAEEPIPAGAPPEALAHYAKGPRRAILLRAPGGMILASYSEAP